MKVTELASRRRRTPLSPLRARVLQHLEQQGDEVFPYRDGRLAQSLGVKVSALSFTLWSLHRDGLIEKEYVDGKVYFGSRSAVAELRLRLGRGKADPFQQAKANRDQIWTRTGDIDVLKLLDAVRGPWK